MDLFCWEHLQETCCLFFFTVKYRGSGSYSRPIQFRDGNLMGMWDYQPLWVKNVANEEVICRLINFKCSDIIRIYWSSIFNGMISDSNCEGISNYMILYVIIIF